jgi:hypothetical protein
MDNCAAMVFGGAQAFEVKIAADLFYLMGKHAEGDLRGGAIVCGTQRTTARIGYLDGCSGLGAVDVGDIARENPRVTGSDSLGRFPVYADFIHRVSLDELKHAPHRRTS